jgi:abortive infection bacteriophage resistance protein
MPDLKPPTTYEQQMETLRIRGCRIENDSFCVKILAQVNYYRLSAYFLPFAMGDDSYRPGTDFNKVYRIYEFDKQLRNIISIAIEEVEINLRAKLAYYHAHKYGAIGYLNAENYNDKHRHKHKILMKRITDEIKNNGKAPFVKHHIDRYDGQFPIWAITELFSFGMLSVFYASMHLQDQKKFAKDEFDTTYRNLASWLRCCTDLRNICAHYGRLYFRKFTAVPARISGLDDDAARRLFGAVLSLKALHPDADRWNNEIHLRLKKLVDSNSDVITLAHIGFPSDWDAKLQKSRRQ